VVVIEVFQGLLEVILVAIEDQIFDGGGSSGCTVNDDVASTNLAENPVQHKMTNRSCPQIHRTGAKKGQALTHPFVQYA
jgi:hypothetical protein